MNELMTRREREDLSKVVRMNARVAKANVDVRAAELRADVERQLSTIHQVDAEQWKSITAEANLAVQVADARIAAICEARGIPEKFRPSIHARWHGRGENAVAERRAELRTLAVAKIDADRKAGYQRIEAWTAEKLTVLISGLLTSDEAKTFLNSLPSPESLLPPVQIRAELGDGQQSPSATVATA